MATTRFPLVQKMKTKCPVCNLPVAKTMPVCPHCGIPLNEAGAAMYKKAVEGPPRKDNSWTIAGGFFVLSGALVVVVRAIIQKEEGGSAKPLILGIALAGLGIVFWYLGRMQAKQQARQSE